MPSQARNGGVAYGIAKGQALLGGTSYEIQKGRTLIGGAGYDVLAGPGLRLIREEYKNSNVTITYSETDAMIECSVQGGGSNYSGCNWVLCEDDVPYQLQVGDVVEFAFGGARSGGYSTYRIVFCLDPSNSYNSRVQIYDNKEMNQSYTVTTPCYVVFTCETGGGISWGNNDSMFADLRVVKLKVNGQNVVGGLSNAGQVFNLSLTGSGAQYLDGVYINYAQQGRGSFTAQVSKYDVIRLVGSCHGSVTGGSTSGSWYTYFNGVAFSRMGRLTSGSSVYDAYYIDLVANDDLTISVTYEREYDSDIGDYDYDIYVTTTGPYTIL